MSRVCVVEIASGFVVNVAELGENLPPNCSQPTEPPAGFLWVKSDVGGIGWALVDGQLFAPPVKAIPVDVQIKAELTAIDGACGYNRGLREVILAFGMLTKMMNSVGFKDALGNVVPDTTGNIGIQTVQTLEDQAKALRKQLAALNATPA